MGGMTTLFRLQMIDIQYKKSHQLEKDIYAFLDEKIKVQDMCLRLVDDKDMSTIGRDLIHGGLMQAIKTKFPSASSNEFIDLYEISRKWYKKQVKKLAQSK